MPSTSISLGYLAELYIDFGVLGALGVMFIFGVLFGRSFKFVCSSSSLPSIVNFGLGVMLVMPVMQFEQALVKMVGGFVITFIIILVLKRFLFPSLLRMLGQNDNEVCSLAHNRLKEARPIIASKMVSRVTPGRNPKKASRKNLLRIIESIGFYYPDLSGGTEAYVSSLAKNLEMQGIECIVAAPSPSEEASRYVHEGVAVFRYPVPERWSRRRDAG